MINKKPYFLIVILCIVFCNRLNAQSGEAPKVSVGKNIVVATQPKESQLIEPHIVAHPNNPLLLLASASVINTSNDKNTDYDIDHCVSFFTKDGGLTWKRNDLQAVVGLDSWVSLTDTEAVLTTLAIDSINSKSRALSLFAYVSNDGGENWMFPPQNLGLFHDGPRATSNINGDIFLTSHRGNVPGRTTIFVAKKPKSISHFNIQKELIPSNLNIAIDGIVTFVDGTLAITYQDFQRPVSGSRKDKNGKWRGVLKTRRQWLITSNNDGQSFSEPKLITEDFYDRANDLVVDKSKTVFKDNIYCIGSSTDYKSVLFTYSSDKGETWTDTEPIESMNESSKLEPHIAVNNNGIVLTAWLDNRDYSGNKFCFSPYIAISMDGGKTFGKPIKVSDSDKSCVNEKLAGTVSKRWPEGGDYFGLTASADGKFHILWPDARSGKFDLYTTSITIIQ